MTLGLPEVGWIPVGLPYYVPPDQLGLPVQNFADVKGNYSLSTWANQKIATLPKPVNQVNTAGAEVGAWIREAKPRD